MTAFSRVKALALASVSSIALSATAQAQQVYNWTGFYAGVNAGWAWSRSDASTGADCSAPASPPGYLCTTGFSAPAVLVTAAGSGSLDGDGFTGGVQAGFNWQANNFVYGVELDFGAFDIGASRSVIGSYGAAIPGGIFTITNAVDTDWLFTARARLGWTFSNVLLYATGGLAVTNIATSNAFSDAVGGPTTPFVVGAWGRSETKLGWTIGAGLEWALGRHWSVKAEYLYLDFGSVGASGILDTLIPGTYTQGISTSVDVTAHIARAGVNFRF